MVRYPVRQGLDVSVSIRREGGSAHVTVHAPMYRRTEWELPNCYSDAFTDYEILKDRHLNTILCERYG